MSGNARIENREFAAPAIVAVLQRRALLVGVVFAVAAVIGFIVEPQQAMHSYLLAFMFCLGPTLGAMSLLMIWHLTGGDWGVGVRRIWEAAVGTLPMMAAAFVPIVLGAYRHMNYPWANPEELKRSEHLAHQAARYLNPNLFLARGILFFLAWGVMAYFLLTWSEAQDHPPKHAPDKRFQALSAVGIIVFGWTMTFAVVDWVMSLAPEFTSTIYGLIFMVGQALLALCLAVIVAHIAEGARTDGEGVDGLQFSRLWKADAHLRDAVGLLQFFAVADRVVGKSAGGDPLVRGPHPGRLARGGGGADRGTLRNSVRHAAVARAEAEFAQADVDCGVADRDAVPRSVLEHRAQLQPGKIAL